MMWWKRLKKDNSEKQEKLQEQIERNGGLEKNDMFAMIFSAMVVILPAALFVLILICLVIMLPLWLA